MEKKVLVLLVFVLSLGVFAHSSAIPQDDEERPGRVEKATCLGCHGSFDDIAAATADYTAPSGETTTPHRYIPHAEQEFIPECVECHIPHPIPPDYKEPIVKPEKIDYCYASCHHAQDLQPCSACH